MLFVSIVLDGAGVGDAPDAEAYGDAGSDTLGHVCERERPHLPNLQTLGLGNAAALSGRALAGVASEAEPQGAWGRMTERAAGKDSTTGHWALAGLVLETPFPTYPDGFPPEIIQIGRASCRER